MSREAARKDFTALNAAYQRDMDAIGREVAAKFQEFEARINALQARQRAMVEAIAKREGISVGEARMLGAGFSRPGRDQMRRRTG